MSDAEEQEWAFTRERIAGWNAEAGDCTWKQFAQLQVTNLGMPMTVNAASDVKWWLSSHPDHEEGKRVAHAVAAKLWKAFNRLVEEAENLPTPNSARELETAERLKQYVHDWFEHTERYEDAKARAAGLYERWKAALDQQAAEGEAVYDRMCNEANAAWPAIVKTLSPAPFEPNAAKGSTVLLKGVLNRRGWDFDSQYDFAVHAGGIAVAGTYDPKVRAAVNDACERAKVSIDNHRNWDVIGVVEGPGTINERFERDVRLKGSTETVKVEGTEPKPCVMLRIVGLRVGPVVA